MKSEYHGIYAALVTPYTSEGKVDYRELQKLVDYLICQGLEGFYVIGRLLCKWKHCRSVSFVRGRKK